MKSHRKTLFAALALAAAAALLTATGAGRALADIIASIVEVQAVPGDRAGGKVAYQRYVGITVPGGSANTGFVQLPAGSQLTVETVTVSTVLPLGQVPQVQYNARLGDQSVPITIALQQEGTFRQGLLFMTLWTGTHAVRFHTEGFNGIDAVSFGTASTANSTFEVSLSGYLTQNPTALDVGGQ